MECLHCKGHMAKSNTPPSQKPSTIPAKAEMARNGRNSRQNLNPNIETCKTKEALAV